MNCCNDFGQCKQGFNCPARTTHIKLSRQANTTPAKPEWKFCPMPEKSPQSELASDLFYFIGFVLLLIAICAAAGLVWGLLSHFYPPTACMVQMLFSTACK
jgi:hypothetical protein